MPGGHRFDTRGLSRDPLAQEPTFMDYPAYVAKLCRDNGITPEDSATLETNEFMLSELFPEVNAQAGYAAYVLGQGVGVI